MGLHHGAAHLQQQLLLGDSRVATAHLQSDGPRLVLCSQVAGEDMAAIASSHLLRDAILLLLSSVRARARDAHSEGPEGGGPQD